MTACNWCHDPLEDHETTVDDQDRQVRSCPQSAPRVTSRDIALAHIREMRDSLRGES